MYYLRDFNLESKLHGGRYYFGAEIGKVVDGEPTEDIYTDEIEYEVITHHETIDECLDAYMKQHEVTFDAVEATKELYENIKIKNESLDAKDVAYLSSKVEAVTGKSAGVTYYTYDFKDATDETSNSPIIGKVVDGIPAEQDYKAAPEGKEHRKDCTTPECKYHKSIDDCISYLEKSGEYPTRNIMYLRADEKSLSSKEIDNVKDCAQQHLNARGLYYVDNTKGPDGHAVGIQVGKVVRAEDHPEGFDLCKKLGGPYDSYIPYEHPERANLNGSGMNTVKYCKSIDECFDYIKEQYPEDSAFKNAIRSTWENRFCLNRDEINQFNNEINGRIVEWSKEEANFTMYDVEPKTATINGKETSFYAGYVPVPQEISENNKAFITFNESQIEGSKPEERRGTCSINIPLDAPRNMRVKQNGEYVTKQTTGADLKTMERLFDKYLSSEVDGVFVKSQKLDETMKQIDMMAEKYNGTQKD